MARTARFGLPGVGDEVLSVNYRANSILRLTSRVTGYFVGGAFQRALESVHYDAAAKVQLGMVETLESEVAKTGRRQRGSMALEYSLLDDRNAEVSASGLSVLRPAWMMRSPAKLYWRRIEEGASETFNAYILFTNAYPNGKRYGPWSPGGHSAQSASRSGRSGNNNLYSRRQPPGYKHMRMPQGKGAFVMNIGPFPAYRYTRGGVEALQRYPFKTQYKKALAAVGIDLKDHLR